MGVFCDRLKLGSTALTGQNKGRYRKKELSLLLVLLALTKCPLLHGNMKEEQTQKQTNVFTKTSGGCMIAVRDSSFIYSK